MLNDEELWKKSFIDEPISKEDLGSKNTQGAIYKLDEDIEKTNKGD